MAGDGTSDDELMALVRMLAAGSTTTVLQILKTRPQLARACFAIKGATRHAARDYFLTEIGHYVYAGDTALHMAAAAYRTEIVHQLIKQGADVRARNRLGAEPLHLAAMGMPGASHFNPPAQTATIATLIEAGADPNATDKHGVAPLHRAVRMRCAAAVKALLEAGADSMRPNKNGSTPMMLAGKTTGRGGSGSPEAKAQQQEIVRLLAQGPA